MFGHHVSAAQRSWEAKERQESLANEALENRSSYQKLQNDFFLQRNIDQKNANLQATDERFAQSREQGKWLEKTQVDSKEFSFERTLQRASGRENLPTQRPGEPAPQANKPQPTAETTPTDEPMRQRMVNPGAERGTPSANNFGKFLEVNEQGRLNTGNLKTFGMNSPEGAEKKEAFQPVFGGIQNAIKEPTTMPGFSFTSSDAQREHAWRHRFDDEAANLGMAGRIRQGAIVEPGREYKNVAVNETLMPRLMELVQKLSAMGHSWARVVVPVDNRTNVVVRFNNQSGRIKIHLSTPSDELCRMIQAGWNALVGNLNERGINLDEPTFETNPYEH